MYSGSEVLVMESKTEKLGKKALNKFTKRITDEWFIFIQNDAALLKEYHAAVKESTQQGVNSALGKMITEAYHLENLGIETKPDCTLLKKYTKHKVQLTRKNLSPDEIPEQFKGTNLFAKPKKSKKNAKINKKQKNINKHIEETALFED